MYRDPLWKGSTEEKNIGEGWQEVVVQGRLGAFVITPLEEVHVMEQNVKDVAK